MSSRHEQRWRLGIRWLVLATCLWTLGCGASTAVPRAPVDQVLFTASSDGTPLSVPFVEVEVGERRLLALFDTGAEVHFITAGIAWERGVAAEPVEFLGRDAHGVDVGEVEIAAAGAMRFDELAADVVLVVASPNLARLGIRAGISPQRWARPDRAVVVDGPRALVRFLESAAEPSRASEVVLCREGTDPRDGASLVATMEVGGIAARMLLDTGNGTTVLSASSPAGAALIGSSTSAAGPAAPKTMLGVSSEARIDAHAGASVRMGGRSWRATIATTSRVSGACGTVGIVGWDLLQHCQLTVGPVSGGLSCRGDRPTLRRAPVHPEVPVVLRSVHVASACASDGYEPTMDATLPFTYASGDVLYNVLQG